MTVQLLNKVPIVILKIRVSQPSKNEQTRFHPLMANNPSPRRWAASVHDLARLTGSSAGTVHAFLKSHPRLYTADRPRLVATARAVLSDRISPPELVVETLLKQPELAAASWLAQTDAGPKLLPSLLSVMHLAESNPGIPLKASPVGDYERQVTTSMLTPSEAA